MSTVPHRKPDTPLNKFYMTGMYEKPVLAPPRFVKQNAFPSVAASMNERNRSPFEDVNVKPITQSPIDPTNYKKGAYLKPFQRESIQDRDSLGDTLKLQPQLHKRFFSMTGTSLAGMNKSMTTQASPQNTELKALEMSLNSTQFNRLINKKKNVEEGWAKPTFNNIPGGMTLQASDFNDKRKSLDLSLDFNRSSSITKGGLSTIGKLIPEKILQASRDENQYFKNTAKIFSKDVAKESVYKRQIPEYLRLMEDPRNQVKILDVDKTGMITIVSKNQGWITVTPRSMNRKKPLERQGKANEVAKTSILTPSWMQIPINQEVVPKKDPLHGEAFPVTVKKEHKRTFLVEKEQPLKSVFALGTFRHNVAFGDQASTITNSPKLLKDVHRPFEWKEDAGKQRYDSKPITGKIGWSSPIHGVTYNSNHN